jgi:hypothetical protein
MVGRPVQDREHWTLSASRLGVGSVFAILAIGILYLATIALWLIIKAAPLEPIGDPFLAVMEGLTMVSALALLGLGIAIWHFADHARRVYGLVALTLSVIAASLTMAVHFIQLTAIRQLWRAGHLADYRLVWPSAILAVEYFAWDVLVGAMMVFTSFALAGGPKSVPARRTMLVGGVLCLAGVVGPGSGRMVLQNIAVTGYAILLPVACALTARVFRAVAPSNGAAA